MMDWASAESCFMSLARLLAAVPLAIVPSRQIVGSMSTARDVVDFFVTMFHRLALPIGATVSSLGPMYYTNA